MILNKLIDCKLYNYSYIERLDVFSRSETSLKRNGTIIFKGTESELDKLLDSLYANERNIKVIGIYNLDK